MSVYISGMDMPVVNKILVITGGGDVWEVIDPDDESKDKHLDGVKVIPVPDHGRLIDADELTALMYANIALFDSAPGRMGEEQKLVRAWLASMVDDIEDAPTIIPADKEAGE